MPTQVVSGAMMMCTMGMAPSTLTVLPTTMVSCSKMPAATIMDFAPMVNIAPFGMCMSLANPEVAAATAAAMGALTPMPCVPVTTPWTPGAATVMYGGLPALDNVSMCQCAWAGTISIAMPGQMQTSIP